MIWKIVHISHTENPMTKSHSKHYLTVANFHRKKDALSHDETAFNESKRRYQEAPGRCGYDHVLQYGNPAPPQLQQTRNRKRKIIRFNPPFSKNVTTNIGKYFLNLFDRHFPKNHKYRKHFNRNAIKISYSCMPNMSSVINNDKKSILW